MPQTTLRWRDKDPRQSPAWKLMQVNLGRKDLARIITDARTSGTSWRKVADELATATGVRVTGETLRLWGVVLDQSVPPAARHARSHVNGKRRVDISSRVRIRHNHDRLPGVSGQVIAVSREQRRVMYQVAFDDPDIIGRPYIWLGRDEITLA